MDINDITPTFGRVAIVDDDPSVRRSLASLLEQHGYRVSVFDDAQSFLESDPEVDVILLDMRMPGLSGVNLQEQLKIENKNNHIVFMSGDSHPEEIIKAMKQGAIDFLLKPFAAQTVLDVLMQAMKSSAKASALISRHQKVVDLLKKLTPRELEICQWMVRGYSNQQISVLDGGAAATIKLHRARVMEKLEVASLPELIDLLSGVDIEAHIKPERASIQTIHALD
jgi:FixJ family two-component response regulator